LCATNEAKKSLRDWQQAYAREVGKEELLPRGGSMVDKELRWVVRVGRVISGGLGGAPNSGGGGSRLGGRSGFWERRGSVGVIM